MTSYIHFLTFLESDLHIFEIIPFNQFIDRLRNQNINTDTDDNNESKIHSTHVTWQQTMEQKYDALVEV